MNRNKSAVFALLTLLIALLTVTVANAQDTDYQEKMNACYNLLADAKPYLDENKPGLLGSGNWDEAVEDIRIRMQIACGNVLATVTPEKYAAVENELSDAAYDTLIGIELYILSIENPEIPILKEESDRMLNDAQTRFDQIYHQNKIDFINNSGITLPDFMTGTGQN